MLQLLQLLQPQPQPILPPTLLLLPLPQQPNNNRIRIRQLQSPNPQPLPHPPPIPPPTPLPLPPQNKRSKIIIHQLFPLFVASPTFPQPQLHPQLVADKSLMIKILQDFCLHCIICQMACLISSYSKIFSTFYYTILYLICGSYLMEVKLIFGICYAISS